MKNIFLTFDMDWAIDEVLIDFYKLLLELDVCGTINVTHDTKLIKKFREDGILELGIHPNYNMLLDGMLVDETYASVIKRMKLLVPEAVTVRSHSLTANSRIHVKEAEYGLKYDLNMFYSPSPGDCIWGFKDVSGMYKLPFIYEDDIWMMFEDKKDVEFYLSESFIMPRIFNFHPIHIFLNTTCIEHYEKARAYFSDYVRLKDCCNLSEYGIRDFFVELVLQAKKKNMNFCKIKEGEW